MLISIRLIIYSFVRNAKKSLIFLLILSACEFLFFALIRAAGAAGERLDADLAYSFFTAAPVLFYLIPLIIPLYFFLRTTTGSEACLMRSLPAAPDAQLSAMIISTVVWGGIAEAMRTLMSAYALSMTGTLAELERGDFFILVLSAYGPSGYTLKVTRNILAVVCFQLFFAMAVLLAAMSLRRKKLLTVIYLLAGGVMMVPAFVFLTSGGGIENAGSSGAAFFHYLPQLIFLMCFIVLFSIVTAFLLKRKHEIV